MQKPNLMRMKEVAYHLGVSDTTVWRLSENDPHFPKKIYVTSRCVGWKHEEIDEWVRKKQLGYC